MNREKHQAANTAPQDRSGESSLSEQKKPVLWYHMLVSMKDEPNVVRSYMNAGSDLEHAKLIAKIIAANAAVDTVMLVEYEQVQIKKRMAWCSLIEQDRLALAVGDTEQAVAERSSGADQGHFGASHDLK